ncbi:MAG: hypothetical protein Q9216_005058 [Gyalolechia sp. 2 TL-2023]
MEHSMCCGPTDICLSNGLCYVADINRLHRGSCTDSSWNARACSTVCISEEDAPTGWADVISCSASSAPNMFYCGFDNEGRCNPGPTRNVFSLPNGYFADQRNLTPAASGQASASATISVTTVSATTICSPAAAVQESAKSTAKTEKSCSSHAGVEAGIGIAVGLPLALGLGTALILLFREKRRGQEKLNEQHNVFVEQQLALDRQRYLQNTYGLHEADSKPHITFHEAPA